MKRCTGNLRGAPLFLRPSVVRALVGDVETIARRVVAVPVLPVALVDQPAQAVLPAQGPNDEITRFDTSHGAAANDARADWEPADWPDAPLPDVADPDLDRPEAPAPDSHEFDCGRPPVEESGLAGMAAGENARQCQLVKAEASAPKRSPQPDPEVARHRAPRLTDGLYRSARRADERALEAPVDLATAPSRAAQLIREATRGEALCLEKPKPIDWARVAAAHRNHAARPAPKRKPIGPAPSREECPRCGVPGWKGCDHFLPCEDSVRDLSDEHLSSARAGRRSPV